MAKLSWGILGTGRIAGVFAKALAASSTGKLVAVGSRAADSAKRFADEHKAERAHASYEALLADPAVQAVYISTPHPQHARWAVAAAEAGKHLLVEKPIGMNAAEAMAIADAAAVNRVFCMEAFMYRCHPQTRRLVELIREGAIGEVRMIQAAFGFHANFDPKGRLFDPALGGGGILDVGCYPVSIARLIAGAAQGKPFAEPADVAAVGQLGQSGVDDCTAATLKFPGGIVAQVSTAVTCNLENVVRVFGTQGSLFLPRPWGIGGQGDNGLIVVSKRGEPARELVVEADRGLYVYQADTVADAVARGDLQAPSPAMTSDDSIGNARVLDRWRKAIGLAYPDEKEKPDLFPATISRQPLKVRAQRIPRAPIAGVGKDVARLVMGLMGDVNHTALMFDQYWEMGGNAFDTSWHYGKQDAVIGRWLRSRGVRKDAVILAKGAHTPYCNPTDLTKQLIISLESLQTDCADIYLMHRDNEDVPVGEFVDVLNEHQRKGRIKVFGGSNWSQKRLQAANEYAAKKGLSGFTVVSNNFSLARMVNPVWAGCIAASDADFRAWLTKTQMPVLAWSSQARGFFVRGAPEERSDQEMVNSWYSDDNFERLRRAKELAAKKGCTAINVALAYVLQQPFPMYALIGPANPAELRTTLPALDVKLSPEEMRWLNLEGAQAAAPG